MQELIDTFFKLENYYLRTEYVYHDYAYQQMERSNDPVFKENMEDLGQLKVEGRKILNAFIFENGEGRDTILNGITIVNAVNDADNGGGIIVGIGCSPTIKNVDINDCSSGVLGGGVYVNSNASPLFINCRITNCDANDGGGVYCETNSSATFDSCTFINNTALSTDE